MFQVHITFGGRQAQPTKVINLRDIDDDMQVTEQIKKTKAENSTFCPVHRGTSASIVYISDPVYSHRDITL